MPLPSFSSSTFTASEQPLRRYHYLDVPSGGPAHKGTIIFFHGFPDTSLTWVHLVRHFSARGYRCLAPDMLGYGRTSRPSRAQGRLGEYSFRSMTGDMAALVRHALAGGQDKDEQVIVVSHDWGAGFAWRFTQYYPHLVRAMCAMCIPYPPMSKTWVTTAQRNERIPSFGYQAFFEEERSTAIIEDNIEAFLRGAFANPGLFTRDQTKSRPASQSPELPGVLEKLLTQGKGKGGLQVPQAEVLLDDETMRYYVETFGQGKSKGENFSLDGGLNWYRTRRINFDDEQAVQDKKYPNAFPVLVIVPELDAALPPHLFATLKNHVPHAERVDLPQCGHFVQLERPKEICSILDAWLAKCGFDGGATQSKKAKL